MPAAHLQLQYKSQIFTAGIAAQYENLKPKLVSGNPPIKSNEHVENVSFWRKVLVEGAKTIGAIAATATVLIGWYAKKKAV